MALNDLKEAMEMFRQGVTDYQTTQAVNDARQQLSGLQYQESKKGEYQQQASQIGNDLALRLTAAHASPQAIATATNGLVPSASVTAQDQSTLGVEGMKNETQLKVEKMKADNALQVHQMMLDAALGKDRNKDKKQLNAMADAFGKQGDVQPILKGMNALDESLVNFDETKGGMGATMSANLAKMGILKSAVSRITDREYAAADATPAGRDHLWNRMVQEFGVTGQQPQNITDFWQKVVQAHKDKAIEALSTKAKGYAKAKASLNDKVDESQLSQALHDQYGMSGSRAPASGSAADVAAAIDWLSSEDGLKADPATRKGVLEQIKAKQGK